MSAASKGPASKPALTSQLHTPAADISTDDLLRLIDRLNRDPAVHGILVQLPLPKGIDELRVLEAIQSAEGR